MMRVIKIGGRAQNDERLFKAICDAWIAAPGSLCVVHGGGDEVSSLQRAMGRDAVFVGGRRVTSQSDIELLRMVLSGVVNKKLVSRFQNAGIPALGLSGEDGGLIEAEVVDSATLGLAGRPRAVNARLLHTILDAGYMPVISPVSYNCSESKSSSGALNVNGDDAAAAIAVALEADELLLVADVRGVRTQTGEFAQSLNVEQAKELIDSGVAAGGMAAKLESATNALAAGVERVRICDPEGIRNQEQGTYFTQSAGFAI
jgi:acetylglutamate kinase